MIKYFVKTNVATLMSSVLLFLYLTSTTFIESKDATNNIAMPLIKPIEEQVQVMSIEKVESPEKDFGSIFVEPAISVDELELLALVTMAEAEGESEEGKRLVIDTILNRVDSVYFPDTITEVIFQDNQFTSMSNGRIDRCYVDDDICQLVYEELEERTNCDVIFFKAGEYSDYGTPMFQVGGHCFSSY